jgi:hypothetical protein
VAGLGEELQRFVSKEKIEGTFPLLQASGYTITSCEAKDYNCFSWAAHDVENWWCHFRHWPEGVAREYTLEAYMAAFGTLGYMQCENGKLENGYEKIAIYVGGGCPKHAARQKESGRWTSKLGRWEDIEHELDGLAGGDYGDVSIFMRRPRR